MPHLLATRPPPPPTLGSLIPNISVVRIPRPDSQVSRKSDPPPPEPARPAAPSRPAALDAAVPRQNITLPFEINPRLPAGPSDLALGSSALGPSPGDLFSVGELDQPLVTLARMPPLYPLAAKRKGTEGWVTVRFVVTEQGTVEKVSITEARPPGIFDESVRRCVSAWRFKPGTVDGRPVRVWAETTVRFELD
jgi:protein TonB